MDMTYVVPIFIFFVAGNVCEYKLQPVARFMKLIGMGKTK